MAEKKPSVLLVRLDKDPAVDKHLTIEAVSRVLGSGFSETPTIFLADDYDLKTRLKSIRVGAKAFFVRPFSPLDLGVTMSCGVAMFPDFDDVPSLTEAADQALYEAKSKGRNRVVVASPNNPKQAQSANGD